MKKAGLFQLKAPDWLKSAIVAAIGSVCGFVYNLVTEWANNTPIVINKATFLLMLKGAVGAAIPYLTKNFLSNSAGNFAQSESKAPTVVTIPKTESNATIVAETTTTIKR